jgi:hypothetical protein
MRTETYFVINGKLSIYKTPGARLLYGIDLADWLAKTGSQLDSVTAAVAGVTLDGPAFVDGTQVCAWIQGLDEAEGAVNTCTFTFICTDGKSTDSRTIHFLKRPS